MPRKDETPLNSDFADLLHEIYDGSVEEVVGVGGKAGGKRKRRCGVCPRRLLI
jgi:hypothetical protein